MNESRRRRRHQRHRLEAASRLRSQVDGSRPAPSHLASARQRLGDRVTLESVDCRWSHLCSARS